MRARGLWTGGWIAVRRDLVVSDAVIGCDNDRSLAVGGGLRTRLLVEARHAMRCGAIEATIRPSAGTAALRQVLVPEAFLPEDDQGPGDGVDDAGLAVDGPAEMELLADDRAIFLPPGR